MKNLLYILFLVTFISLDNTLAVEIKPDSTLKTILFKDSLRCMNHAERFIDKNHDGINDIAPDEDGDGIPNGLDCDYKAKHEKIHKGIYYNYNDSTKIKKKQQKGFRFRHRWNRNR